MQREIWDGLNVYVKNTPGHRSGHAVGMRMSLTSASALSLAIKRLRNTTQVVPPAVEELEHAIDFVLVGDPTSMQRWRRIQAAKGMEPAGADPRSYAPDHPFVQHEIPDRPGEFRCGYARSSGPCWRTREEHPVTIELGEISGP